MKIKNRRVLLHQIKIPVCGRTYRHILVTSAQLAKLHRAQVGTEIFLNCYYCHTGGDFWVIRTKDGLHYMPNPYRGDPDDARLLETLLVDVHGAGGPDFQNLDDVEDL
jgi:hypothetical protein